MAFHKIPMGTDENTGAQLFHYIEDDDTRAAVLTGPHANQVAVMSDGTQYDFEPVCISIDMKHQDEVVAHLDSQSPDENVRAAAKTSLARFAKKGK